LGVKSHKESGGEKKKKKNKRGYLSPEGNRMAAPLERAAYWAEKIWCWKGCPQAEFLVEKEGGAVGGKGEGGK